MGRTADLSTNDGSQTTAENYLQGMMRVTVASKLCPWENFQERGQNKAYLQIRKNWVYYYRPIVEELLRDVLYFRKKEVREIRDSRKNEEQKNV